MQNMISYAKSQTVNSYRVSRNEQIHSSPEIIEMYKNTNRSRFIFRGYGLRFERDEEFVLRL